MRDELLEQSLKRCDEVFAEPARQIEQLQSALKAENAAHLAEIEQLKAHNRQLVEFLREIQTKALDSTNGPNGFVTWCALMNPAIFSSPPAKLALAEADVLRLLPEYLEASKTQDYGEYFDEFLVSKFDPAVEAMQEAKGDAK